MAAVRVQVPTWYEDHFCSHIHDADRRTKCGMIAAMDESVNNVTEALKQRGMMDNTFIIFMSDNGGPVHVASSNWPLRGSKITIWEGGTRSAGFVYSPRLLQRSRSTYDGLIHMVDWYPTLVDAAGGNASIANIDGMSQWKNLLSGGTGPRTEFLYNMDEVRNNSALRQGRFKLIQGHAGSPNGWFATPELNETTVEVHSYAHSRPDYMLFDLVADPEERHDVQHSHQDVFHRMKNRLDEYRPSLVLNNMPPRVDEANPSRYDGNWSPGWC